MAVNNEIGVKQPIKEIGNLNQIMFSFIKCNLCACNLIIFVGEVCKSKKVFFHTDAAQAVGKINIDVTDQNIDLMSISGHKLYGPKGKKQKLIFKNIHSILKYV